MDLRLDSQERLQFRFQTPPRVVCPACDTVFVFYAQLEQHLDWSHRTCPVKHNKVKGVSESRVVCVFQCFCV